jgi:beta-lactamase regulating signal transducer with metallopeptidase domain
MSYGLSLFGGSLAGLMGKVALHFLWQGAVCAGMARIALLLHGSGSAQRRYAICCAALLVMAACPLATFVSLAPGSGIYLFSRSAIRLDTPAGRQAGAVTAQADAPQIHPAAVMYRAAAQPLSSRASRAVTSYLPWLAVAWLAGVVLLTVRLLLGWAALAYLDQKRTEPISPDWAARFEALCARMRLRRKVQLKQSAGLEVPAAIGSLRATVLAPATALATLAADQMETLLAHELAHIRRCDSLVNLGQLLLETLLFFHPAVWWISRQIRIEREHCCDALVLTILPDRLTYARALTSLEAMRTTRLPLALAGDGGSLMNRIHYIVGRTRERSRLTPGLIVGLLALHGAAAALAWGLHSTADPVTPSSAGDLMKQVRDYYQGLHDFGMAIEHRDTSGLMPGRYTQTLHWRDDNRFELITTEYNEFPDHKADFYADGKKVTARTADGRVAEEDLHGQENISYGWEVSGGPIMTWLQHTVSGRYWLSKDVQWSYGPRKLWHGHKVREVCMHWVARPGIPAMNFHVSYFVDAQKPILIGMETDAYHKAQPGYEEYRNQTVNNRFSDQLGKLPVHL